MSFQIEGQLTVSLASHVILIVQLSETFVAVENRYRANQQDQEGHEDQKGKDWVEGLARWAEVELPEAQETG